VCRIDVKSSERLYSSSSSYSKGNQLKWKCDNHFVKLDSLGYEGIAEMYVSKLLDFTSVKHVKYDACIIYEDGVLLGTGCISENFVSRSAEEVTFGHLLKQSFLPFSIEYDFLLDFIYDVTGLDAKKYIDTILCIDAITKNDDRHFYNMSMLIDDGAYSFSPVYDNGSACLSDTVLYPYSVSLQDNIRRVLAKPFSTNFKYQLRFVDRLIIDYDGFIKSVNGEHHRALDVIKYGLVEMEGIAWERC